MLRERLKAKILGNISILSLSLLLGLVAEEATVQRGGKRKALLCKGLRHCASWWRSWRGEGDRAASLTYEWAP